MMPVAAISRVTVDRLYRWLMAGEDDAWPQRPSAALHEPRSACTTTVTAPIWPATCPLPLACRRPGPIDPCSLRRICRPNLHSAR
jgi:hypothetical protein